MRSFQLPLNPPARSSRRSTSTTDAGRIAFAAMAVACTVACGRPAAPARAVLLADVGPSPRAVAMSVNSARRATLRNAPLVTSVVNGFPASTQFFVLTNDRAAFTVARNDRPGRVRFLDLPLTHPFTIWTQDPFLVLTGSGGDVTLLTSKDFDRADDRLMAEVLGRDAGYSVRPSGLFFEGGNIVSDLDYVLIGANTIRRNAIDLDVSDTEVALRFEEELGRPVLVVGPFPQPIAHIDMMVTPIGGRRVALADPMAGARIAEEALKESPGSVTDFEEWCERYFFGHPSIRHVGSAADRIAAPEVRGRTAVMAEQSRRIAPLLDQVAHSLEQHGYRVERIPFLFGGPEDGDDAQKMQPAYPMLTYNNVLLADDAGARRVYLPRYGWAAMDDAAARAWRSLGFVPQPVDGLTISAMYGGALRCAVKVLSR